MKKRILSVLLVVAMLATMVVMPVYATDTATQSATPSQYTDENGYCLCGCGTLWEDIEWTALTKGTTLTEAGSYHYRLEEDTAINGNAIYLNSTTDVMNAVFDLNGYTLRISGRVGYIKAGNSLHIVDSVGTGAVINCDVNGYNAALTGHWVFTQGTTIIYGGSWSNEGELPVYETATVDNPSLIYVGAGGSLTIKDGSFDVSGMEALGAGLIGNGFITSDTAKEAVINIEDGIFTGDDSSSLGALYIRKKGVLNISGGKFDCRVLQSGGTVTLSGDVKIEELMVQGGSIVDVEGLTSGAEIGVNASPMFAFTNVLTDADAYLGYFTNTNEEYVGDFTVVDGAIKATWSETAKCPHCGTLLKDIADWKCFNTDCKPNTYASADGTAVEGEILAGHYYLNGDIIANSSQYCIGTNEEDTQSIAARDVCLFTMGCEMNTNGNKRMFYIKAPHDLAIVNIMGRASVLSSEYYSGSGGFLYNPAGTASNNAGRTQLQIFNCVLRNSSTNTTAKTGGVIGASTHNTQTFENCVFAGKQYSGNGGVLSCSTGTTNLVDCVFYGSTNGAKGAAIFKAGSALNITNCKIYGGKGTYGAAICYEGSGAVTIENSTITDGTATTDGAGIYLNNASGKGTLTIENSTVGSVTHSDKYTKNADAATAAGLSAVGNYALTLKGEVNIDDLDLNAADGTTSLEIVADISAMTGGQVGVTAAADTVFTSALADADTAKTYAATYFASNVDGLNVRYDDTYALMLTEGNLLRYCQHCEKIEEWAPYTYVPNTHFTVGGHYYLAETCDDAADSQVKISADDTVAIEVVIELNGNSITNSSRRVFDVRPGSQLYLQDSVGTSVLTGGLQSDVGSCLGVRTGSTLTIYGGTYGQGEGKTIGNGGVIYCWTDSALTIKGNAIINGGVATTSGGSIYATGATVNISGNAQVVGGTASSYGGNIYAANESTVTISGNAKVVDGVCSYRGGNIGARNANINISENAVISGGQAGDGGNLFILTNSSLNMTGGTVEDGTAVNDGSLTTYGRGGNIYLGSGGNNVISGGKIINGTTQADDPAKEFGGGNIYLYSDSKLTISGDTIITSGASGTNGGNIFSIGELVLENAVISNGTAVNQGADIYIGDTGSINISENITGSLNMGFADELLGTPVYGNVITNTSYQASELNAGLTLTLDGTYGNAPIGLAAAASADGTYQLSVGVGTATVQNGVYTWHETAAGAVAAYDADSADYIMACGQDLHLIGTEYIVDVNGCNVALTGTAASTAYCFDSANHDYETFGSVTCDENVTVKSVDDSATEVSGATSANYIMLENNGSYSFHALDLAITAIGLKTSTSGMYYYANYKCDDTLKAEVASYGIMYELYDADGANKIEGTSTLYAEIANTEAGTPLVTGEDLPIGSMNGIINNETEGYTAAQCGELKIKATPYVILKDADIYGKEVYYSMKDCCDLVDDMITEYNNAGNTETADTYKAYMENLVNTTWAAFDLTSWTFDNFTVVRESTEA